MRSVLPWLQSLLNEEQDYCQGGNRAGREFYFVDAEAHEQRYSEYRLIDRVRESVAEMASWRDRVGFRFFSVVCVLGVLSGQCFPMTLAEQRVYLPQQQRVEQADKQHQAPQRSAMLQGV